MRSVVASALVPGSVAQSDYYSEKGELLLSKGITITEKYLDILRRRNIFELFVKLAAEDEELHGLLTRKFKNLGDVDIDDPIPASAMPDIRWRKPGKDGLLQLCQSEKALQLDKKIGAINDRPVGPALKNKATQLSVNDRTEKYKKGISEEYYSALKEVRNILEMLASGGRADGQDVRDIVKNFVRLFVTDKNILLNISGIKHANEDYLFHHTLNVCLLSINIAASSGYNETQVMEIGMGALLHDIGMLLIPSGIRTKEGRLTQDEWYEVQKHPILGLHLLEKVSELPDAIPYVAYQVHERENSTGYPKKRNSVLIHRFAKMAQVADIFEAITSPRSYRPARIPHEGVIQLIKMSRTGMIPDEFVTAFIEYASFYPVGSLVELNDHSIAKVIQANKEAIKRPVVSILTGSTGNLLDNDRIYQIDLAQEKCIQITKPLPSNYLKHLDIMDGF